MDPMHLSASSSEQIINNNHAHAENTAVTGNILLGIWRLIDPKISLASISSIFLGTCIAASVGSIHWGWLALTVAGIFFLEAAKNASGEVFDYEADMGVNDEDQSPFSGGKRVIVDGLMTSRQTFAVAALFYLHGIAAGFVITFYREPLIFVIGLIGVGLAYFYNAPPAKLSYRGFGELAVAVTYGPLICCGTYLVQRHTLPTDVILLSLPLGILIAAFLVINEFPDRNADLAAGKKNLVVRLSRNSAEWLFMTMIIVAYLLLLVLPVVGLNEGIRLGIIGMPFGIMAAIRLMQKNKTTEIIPAQKWTLISFVLAALGSGLGLLIT